MSISTTETTTSRGTAGCASTPVSRATMSAARAARRRRRAALRPPRSAASSSTSADAGAAPITSVTSPFGGSANCCGDLARGAAHDLLEALRQLAAHGDRPPGVDSARGSRGWPASAAATRTRRRARSTPATPPRVRRAPRACAGDSRGRRSARRRGRSRRAPSPRRRGRGARSPRGRARAPPRQGARQGRSRPGSPASLASAIRSPASSRGSTSCVRRASLWRW